MRRASSGNSATKSSPAATPAATPRGHSRSAEQALTIDRVEAVEGPLLGGEEAIEFVVEDLVEGPPRDAGLLDHAGDRERCVTLARRNPGRRVEQPVALVLGDERLRNSVAAPREAGSVLDSLDDDRALVAHAQMRTRTDPKSRANLQNMA